MGPRSEVCHLAGVLGDPGTRLSVNLWGHSAIGPENERSACPGSSIFRLSVSVGGYYDLRANGAR